MSIQDEEIVIERDCKSPLFNVKLTERDKALSERRGYLVRYA